MAQYNRFGQNEKELAGGGSTGPAAPATEFRALVVTGGTEVDIDDVRVISNKSTGRFGCAVANAFAAQGVATTLFGATKTLTHKDWISPSVAEVVPFRTYDELYAGVK
eukprot:gene21585-21489_t